MSRENESTTTLANEIRQKIIDLPRIEKNFLGGIPYTENIIRELNNGQNININALPTRQRVTFSTCSFNDQEEVIGYQVLSIMSKANPTSYEKKYIELDQSLDYVQERFLFVTPNYRGTGTASKLITFGLNIAQDHHKDFVVDLLANNKKMLSFLSKHNIHPSYFWNTPHDQKMVRCIKKAI